jgi:hypothetical protein
MEVMEDQDRLFLKEITITYILKNFHLRSLKSGRLISQRWTNVRLFEALRMKEPYHGDIESDRNHRYYTGQVEKLPRASTDEKQDDGRERISLEAKLDKTATVDLTDGFSDNSPAKIKSFRRKSRYD